MFARTERLLLRPGWPEDAPALAAAIAHEAVAMRLARLPWPYTLAHAEAWLTLPRDAADADFVIIAREAEGSRLVGGIGLHPRDEEHELGYWLTPSVWGRGYATEAARAIVTMARDALGYRRLVSGYFVDNPASGRVLQKLGFRQVGRERRTCLARNGAFECALLARDLAEDRTASLPIAA